MKTTGTIFLIFFSLLLLSVSCSDSASENTETGTLQIMLTDAPANYEAVYIDIQQVRIHRSGNAKEEEDGWIDIQTEPIRVNLLDLTNGRMEALGEIELEAGRYNQLRLILGSENEIVIDGVSHDLKTPSAQQSGLKLNLHADIEAGNMYTLLLDFDANKSIVVAGNSGNILLKPVIRTAWLDLAGAIEGKIKPAQAMPWIYAIAGEDTLGGTRADEEGDFRIIGLPANTYQLSIKSWDKSFLPVVISGLSVEVNKTTDTGTITLPEE